MSVPPNRRLATRVPEDDLLPERPAPQAWRDVHPAPRGEEADRAQPAILVQPARAPSALDTLSRGLGALIKLTLLAILLAVLWGVVTLVTASTRAPAAIGEQISGALERGASIVGAAGQRVADAFDPAHPPRQALAQDAEIDQLLRIDVGSPVPGAAGRDVTLASVQRRADAPGPDSAVYAVLRSELKTPRETTVLGVTVSSTRDPREHYLYKGETIRLGQKLYKVNWVSLERQQLALVLYRDQDRVAAPLKAEID